MKSKIFNAQECPSCDGNGIVAIECCNGYRCSCRGQAVEMQCNVCEATGKINEKSDLSANSKFIFDNNMLYLGNDLGGR
jgi:hypothetical protein